MSIKVTNSRPGDGGKTFEDVISEILRRKVAVLEEGTRFYFDVANRAKLFDQGAERVKGADGLG